MIALAIISLIVILLFKNIGFWLALSIIALYFILVFIRFLENYRDNRKLSSLHDLSDKEMSQLLKNYFKNKGWILNKEKGNDLILENDKEKIFVRFYQYQNLINSPQLQSFRKAMNQIRADKGYFITTSDFNKSVQEDAGYLIKLINGQDLLKMLKIKNLKGIKNG